MSDSTTISGPIQIKDNSKERVALDLMYDIRSKNVEPYKTEQEIITLYCKCLMATNGVYISGIYPNSQKTT